MTETVNNEAEQVNKEEANVEIVTKEPAPVNPVVGVAKIKDPRKIEAGKKLAAYNKKAKKSKAALKEKKNDDKPVDDENNQGGSGFNNITLTTVVAIIGLGLTGANLYLTHKKIMKKE